MQNKKIGANTEKIGNAEQKIGRNAEQKIEGNTEWKIGGNTEKTGGNTEQKINSRKYGKGRKYKTKNRNKY